MMLLAGLALSLPIGLFLAWFAWRARRVGRLDAARSMAWLSAVFLLTGGGLGAWLFAALD